MSEREALKRKILIVGVERRVCALPLAHVLETMRPLPIESLGDVPAFVLGVAIVRGVPTPVVDLGAMLGQRNESVERFVIVRAGQKQIALCVSTVLGVRDLEPAMMAEGLPALLKDASKDVVEAIGTLDQRVLVVLQDGWELPAEVWQALTVQEAVS